MADLSRPELRAAMEQLAAEPVDPARRTVVLEHLLTGRLLAVTVDGAQPTVLAFTDGEALARLLPSGPRAVVELPELWARLADAGVASATVNGGGPVTVTLDAGELAALAQGRLPEGARDVLFAPLAPAPAGLARAVAAAAAAHPEVLAAYVLEAAAEGERRLVAALRLTPGLAEEHAAGVVEAVVAELAAAGATAVSTTPWEAELIAASRVEPVFARSA